MGTEEEKDQNAVQLTHAHTGPPRSPPNVIWRYRSPACESGEMYVHVGMVHARPGLGGRRELAIGEGSGGRKPDRKESSGRGVRDDVLIVAWQPFLFSNLQDSINFYLLCSFRKLGACPSVSE